MTVRSIRMVGESYRNGTRMPGWGNAMLSDGTVLYVPEHESQGFDAIVAYAERHGHDTKYIKSRLAEWVRTGGVTS